MAFPTGWSSKKLYIPQAKVSGSANHSNFPVLLKDGAIPAAVYSAMQTGEINSSWIKTLSNLKLYCRFQSGALTTDSSGNSNTLTAVSDPAESTDFFGGGVVLDGNDAFSIADHADLKPTGSFTIGLRVKTTTNGYQRFFQSYYGNPNVAGILIQQDTNVTQFRMGQNTGTTENTHWKQISVTNPVIYNGADHIIVCTYDGSNMRLFQDGVQIGSAAWTNNAAYDSNVKIRIGCANSNGTNDGFVTGSMGDFFLLNGTALTAGQIMSLQIGGGADLRFSTDSAGTTEIPFEIVKITPASSTGEVWLKIPTLYYNQNTDFYIWYGKNDATPYEATDTYGSQAVWSDYAAVWHFEGNSRDSTANALHGTDTSITYGTTYGQVGSGALFNGTTSKITIGTSNVLNLTGNQSWFALIKPTTGGEGNYGELMQRTTGSDGIDWSMRDDGTINDGMLFAARGGSTVNTSANVITYNSWHRAIVNRSSSTVTHYINGSSSGSGTIATITSASGGTAVIGNNPAQTATFSGSMDEFRVRGSALTAPADWATTENTMFSDPSTFISAVSVISITKSLGYSILNTHSTTKSQQYAVKRPIGLTKSAQYAIYRTIAAITKGLIYSVVPDNLITKGLEYMILRLLGITKSMAYAILLEQIVTKSMVYAVLTEAAITKSLAYSLVADHAITKSMEYILVSQPVIQKSMSYHIEIDGYIYNYTDRGTTYTDQYQ